MSVRVYTLASIYEWFSYRVLDAGERVLAVHDVVNVFLERGDHVLVGIKIVVVLATKVLDIVIHATSTKINYMSIHRDFSVSPFFAIYLPIIFPIVVEGKDKLDALSRGLLDHVINAAETSLAVIVDNHLLLDSIPLLEPDAVCSKIEQPSPDNRETEGFGLLEDLLHSILVAVHQIVCNRANFNQNTSNKTLLARMQLTCVGALKVEWFAIQGELGAFSRHKRRGSYGASGQKGRGKEREEFHVGCGFCLQVRVCLKEWTGWRKIFSLLLFGRSCFPEGLYIYAHSVLYLSVKMNRG